MSQTVKQGVDKPQATKARVKKANRGFNDLKMYNLEKSINADMSTFEPEMAESERKSWEEVSEFKAG